MIGTIIPIAFAVAITLIVLYVDADDGNPIFWTYGGTYLLGVISYLCIMIVLKKSLDKLDAEGSLKQQKRSINGQFLFFMMAFIIKTAYYFIATMYSEN